MYELERRLLMACEKFVDETKMPASRYVEEYIISRNKDLLEYY